MDGEKASSSKLLPSTVDLKSTLDFESKIDLELLPLSNPDLELLPPSNPDLSSVDLLWPPVDLPSHVGRPSHVDDT